MITVISQTTAEQKKETQQLFKQIQPLLDDGYGYMSALIKIGKVHNNTKNSNYRYRWFRELKEYGETQGYPYDEYSGRGRK